MGVGIRKRRARASDSLMLVSEQLNREGEEDTISIMTLESTSETGRLSEKKLRKVSTSLVGGGGEKGYLRTLATRERMGNPR